MIPRLRIAAIVPCHNEELSIEKVVADLRAAVPGMAIYVYDNCSTDKTAMRARVAGAIVRSENLKGKGNVVRRAFADVDADIYLLIDGDDTYDAAAAPGMIEALLSGPYDHVLGARAVEDGATNAYRPAHLAGNKLMNRLVKLLFGTHVDDLLSGYRVFSRRFVKSFPAVSREFEIETELTVHSLAVRTPFITVPVGFRERAEGTESKLRTYRDGSRILALMATLMRHERPLLFFGFFAALCGLFGTVGIGEVLIQFFQIGTVPRFPLLIGSSALLLFAMLFTVAGLVIDGVRKSRHELSRLAYLTHPPVTDKLPLGQGQQTVDVAELADLQQSSTWAPAGSRL